MCNFSDDADIIALYGDALMNQHPWELWLKRWYGPTMDSRNNWVLENGLVKFPKHVA
jgi:hypothetical protein